MVLRSETAAHPLKSLLRQDLLLVNSREGARDGIPAQGESVDLKATSFPSHEEVNFRERD